MKIKRRHYTAIFLRVVEPSNTQASVSPATLILDDGEMVLPIRLNELSEGEHKWKIRANGYESTEGKCHLRQATMSIYRELESSRGKALLKAILRMPPSSWMV